MKNTKRINEIKEDIKNIFTYTKRGDDTITIFNREMETKYPQLVNIFFKNGFEIRDFYYNTGMEAIEEISYNLEDCKDLEDIKNTIENEEFNNIEADKYTHDLTTWLNENVENVGYITQAREELGDTQDGYSLLSNAQYIAKQEVCYIVKNSLLELLQDLEEKEEQEMEATQREAEINGAEIWNNQR